MQALANFVMRGRSQAAVVTLSAAVLSLLMPPLGMISSAAVVLVTLRKGLREGLTVWLIAAAAAMLLAFFGLGSSTPALGFVLLLWLPMWVLAIVLGYTRSLTFAVQAAALFGLMVILGLHLWAEDPAAHWAQLLEPMRLGLVEGQVIVEEGSEALIAEVAKWMTGAFAASLYFQFVLTLLLGRWWQSLLYNPGGFGEEFRAFRIQPWLGLLAIGLALLSLLQDGMGLAQEVMLLLAPLFLLQGLAVAHGLRANRGFHQAWLIGLYALFFFAFPYAELLVAGCGFADLWVNFRSRFGGRGPDSA